MLVLIPEHKQLSNSSGHWRVETYVTEVDRGFQLAFTLHQNKQNPALPNMFVATELGESISHHTKACALLGGL